MTGSCLLLAAAAVVASCSTAGPVLPAPTVTHSLAIPGRANEHVSLVASGRFVAVAWAAADEANVTDIYASVSRDEGATFTAPVRVNAVAGDARANGEQPPRLALIPRSGSAPDVVAFWTARRSGGTVLLSARSTDEGRSFSASALVPGTETTGNRGWQAIGASPAGDVHAVWLDHRRMAPRPPSATPHVHRPAAAPVDSIVDTSVMAQQSDLYFATIGAGPAPQPVTVGVCYCCKTAIAHGPDGVVYLAWRHVYAGNMRDIALSFSRDGGQTFSAPVRVSEDGWAIAGCPDDGPSMVVDGAGRVHVVWPTMVDVAGTPTKSLFYAMTVDGQTFTPRVRIPTDGPAHHPQIAAAADGSLVVVWDESGGEERRVARARGSVDTGGAVSFRRESRGPTMPGRYPVVAAGATEVVSAWIAGIGPQSVVRVER